MIHALAGTIAMILIFTFWTSTVISELVMDQNSVVLVKQYLIYGLLILVPCLAIAGGSGVALSKPGAKGLVTKKKKRMAFTAINGVLIMLPSAFLLNYKAGRGELDIVFYIVQVAELCGGIVQFILLGLNFKDGMRMRRARLIRG